MSPDTKLIVDAIDSLRQSSSFIKSYIMPFAPALITSVIGFFIATYNFKSQEKMRADALKIEKANKFLVQVENAFQSLVAVKTYASAQLNDHPVQRVLLAGDIDSYFSEISGVDELVFLANGIQVSEGQPYHATWNNISRINTMVGNYYYLLLLIERRKLSKETFEKYVSIDDSGMTSIDNDALESVGRKPLKNAVRDNENVLSILDGLIKEFNSFLQEFPRAVERSVDVKKVKHMTRVLQFNNSNEHIQTALTPCQAADINAIAAIFHVSPERARKMFETGYID
ncbi:TPA: hypothetical protein R4Y92_001410 [Klebsiella aerogenes]|nr:hypothetical protein [Klebsiella aerogenes]